MKVKKKLKSGSLKIDVEVYMKAASHCDKKGIKIGFFATEAIAEKLEKEKTKKQIP